MSTQDDQACNALWLDPYQPAGETERARLAAAGLSLLPVRTLEDLRHALKTAKTVVVRLMDSTELLGEVRLLVEAFKKDIPIICRSAPGNMTLAVAAMRSGACHVIAADDYSEYAWRDALAHVADAEAIIASRLVEFLDWHARRAHVPVIQAFRDSAHQLREQELELARKRLLRGDAADQVLEQMATRLTNKFLHGPLAAMNKAEQQEREQLQAAMRHFMSGWDSSE